MSEIQLKVAELRKKSNITQKELAEYLDVAHQTISKWERGITLPDISLLPKIAEYFNVNVDSLLGIEKNYYKTRNTGQAHYWNEKLDYLKATRKSFWNDDYFEFLVKAVWKINKPVTVADFGCGYGVLGMKLLPLIPKGSSYTGIDISETLVDEARKIFSLETDHRIQFIHSDVMTVESHQKYDVVICQALLRHVQEPKNVLRKMIDSVKEGGLVICIETNRPFEEMSNMIAGYDYKPWDNLKNLSKLWTSELENEERDFSIGLKVPMLMSECGLIDIDVRMNDKMNFIDFRGDRADYKNSLESFKESKGWHKDIGQQELQTKELLRNRGYTHTEIEGFIKSRNSMRDYIKNNQSSLNILYNYGTIITYGYRKMEVNHDNTRCNK